MAASTALPALARLHVTFEVMSHFRAQYAATLALVVLLLLPARLPRTAAIVALAALLNTALVATTLVPRQGAAPALGPVIKVITYNVLSSNLDIAGLVTFVAAEKPDVLVILELTDAHAAALAAPELGLTYSVAKPQTDNFGIGIYSRHPFLSSHIEAFGDPSPYGAVALIRVATTQVVIIAGHPLPPVSASALRERTQYLDAAAKVASGYAASHPVILAGDLNVTPYSPFFDDFRARSRLEDSARGFALQPTWPSWSWILGVPIDHLLMSPGIDVLERRVAHPGGSDHAAVVTRLALP